MDQDWKKCIFGYLTTKGDGGTELLPCKILSKLDDRFVKICYYNLIVEKRKLVDVIIKTTVTYWHFINNWDYTKDWLSKKIEE